jgi:hypothetical protein
MRWMIFLGLLGCRTTFLQTGGELPDAAVENRSLVDMQKSASTPDLTASGCRTQTDCPQGQALWCIAPHAHLCGGPACPLLPRCDSDESCRADAGSNMVCDDTPCCGGPTCIRGCDSAADCLDGQRCTGTHHCVPIPCGSCPMHFVCGESGACERQPCNIDEDCGTGYCVDGACYDELGMCGGLPV